LVDNDQPGSREKSLVECKLWDGRVSVTTARRLLGVVAHERATKGIIVSASSFTRPCREFAASDPRLELLDWDQLLDLLDRHLGADWGRHVDVILSRSMHRTGFAGA
jgi:restriction system protein